MCNVACVYVTRQVLHFDERMILKLREEGIRSSPDTGLQSDLGQVTLCTAVFPSDER